MAKLKPKAVSKNLRAEESSTRQSILRAAKQVFLARGYEGTSMEVVAQVSGAGRRTVYNQFQSKKDLFDATVALLWAGMPLDQVVDRRDPAHSPEQTLVEIGDVIADFWVSNEAVAFLRMIISESIRFPELAHSFFSSGRGVARHALVEYFQALHKAMALIIPDPDLAAAQFIALINGPLLWDRLISGRESPSKKRRRGVVAEAVQMILRHYQV